MNEDLTVSQQDVEDFFIIVRVKLGYDVSTYDYMDLRADVMGPKFRNVPPGHPMRVVNYIRWVANHQGEEA